MFWVMSDNSHYSIVKELLLLSTRSRNFNTQILGFWKQLFIAENLNAQISDWDLWFQISDLKS